MSKKHIIISALTKLCVPTNLKGHRCLVYAIELCADDYTLLSRVMEGLYPAIAEKYDCSPVCVEAQMRYAVQRAFDVAGQAVWVKYFGRYRKVTVLEFIAAVALHIQ